MEPGGSRRPGPAVEPPADVDPRELAPEVRSQLRTLSKVAADRVARHLVAAGRLVDEQPEAALEQARAARALGARVAVVREAVGETAYAAGEWAEAIAELRAARRMTGNDAGLPMIADAERALGRADRALRIAQSPEAQALGPAERAEMRIVEAGARRDLGQLDAALVTLQDFGLDRRSVQPWSARVWYAYADLLLAAGREEEAREWFVAAAGADSEGSTDADERLLELDGIEILTDEGDADEFADPDDLAAVDRHFAAADDVTTAAEPDSADDAAVADDVATAAEPDSADDAAVADDLAAAAEPDSAEEPDRADDVAAARAAGTDDLAGAGELDSAGGSGPGSAGVRGEAGPDGVGLPAASGGADEPDSAGGVEAGRRVSAGGGDVSASGVPTAQFVAAAADEPADDEPAVDDEAREAPVPGEAPAPGETPAPGDPVPLAFSDQADQSGSSS